MAKINGKEALLNLHIGTKPEQTKTKIYTKNGVYEIEPDEGKTLSDVFVTVRIPTYNGETGDITASLLTMNQDNDSDGEEENEENEESEDIQ